MLLLFSVVLIGLLVGMICTFWKPKIWKYYTLIGSQLFFTLCWSIRLAWIESQTWGNFGPPNDELLIILALPLVVIMLIVTAVIAISTRKRWNIPEDKPGFCS